MTLRKPAIQRSSRGLQKASTYSMPAPVGGWNARDPLASMRETDAVALENWYPMAAEVVLRKGASVWASGLPASGKSLLTWNGPTSSKLFIATDSGIFDATASGVLGAASTTCTEGSVSHVNFSIAGGSYLVCVNGTDKLKLYNGTAWQEIDATSTPAITGLATTLFTQVMVAKRRLWFVEQSSSSAWYLPTASIGGALAEFPLGQVFTRGGHLVAMGNWTIDGGDGQDDYTVFLSSEGEAAIYKGPDPADASTFSKVGVYYVGEPLGSNCLANYGGDLLVLCQNGLLPLSKVLQSASVDRRYSLTAKIDTAFNEAASLYGGFAGWSVTVFPQGSFVLVNVPVSADRAEQYVMNSITGAWCKFTGWAANDWCVWDRQLYFVSTTAVAWAWQGTNDFGEAITGSAQQAYTYFRARGRQKHLKLLRPMLVTTGPVSVLASVATDFAPAESSEIPAAGTSTGFLWDADDSLWDTADWSPTEEVFRSWASVASHPFYAAAPRLQVSAVSATIEWSATDFVYEPGGVL